MIMAGDHGLGSEVRGADASGRASGKRACIPNPLGNIWLLHILNDGFLASLSLLLPFAQKELGLGFGSIGFLSGALGSAGVILALPSSSIARRFGGLRVIGIALCLYSAGFIMAGLAPNFILLAVSFIVASVGFGLFHPIGFALIAHGSEAGAIGARMGNFTAIGDFGRIGIAALVTILAAAIGWRVTALAYGIVPLAMVCFAVLFCRPVVAAAPAEAAIGADRPRGLRYSADFIAAIITGSIDGLASSSIFIFIPFFIIYRGISPALLGSMSGAFFVGNMLGKVAMGKLIDRFGPFKVFIASEMVMAASLMLLSAQTSIIAIAAISVLLGAVTKGTVPVINTMVAVSVPDRALYEKAFGIVSFASGIAAVLAPILLGFVAERFGIVSVFRVSAGLALLAIVPGSINAIISLVKRGRP